jgi:hypothetical protein
LSACGSSVKPIQIVSAPLERVPLDLPPVDELKLDEVDWIIVTEENVNSVWEELKKKNYSIVIFGLTDKGYEDLSVNIAKIKQLVQQQKAVIAAYKNYYENQNKAIDKQQEEIDNQKNKIDNDNKAAEEKSSSGISIKNLWK